MFNVRSGRFDLEIPNLQGFDWPELEEKAAELKRFEGEYHGAVGKLRGLTDNRPKAKRQDTQAYAEAIAAGKKDPGAKATDALEEQIAAVARRRDALRVVLEDRGRELLALVEAGREGWKVEALASLSAAEEGLEEARAALGRAEAEVLRHRHVLAWLEGPENYRANKINKKQPKKAPMAPAPTFIVGRPAPRAEGSDVA